MKGSMIDCPVCEAPAEEANAGTFDGIVVQCPECGEFGVVRTVYKTGALKNLDLEGRRSALAKAKRDAEPGERPVISGLSL